MVKAMDWLIDCGLKYQPSLIFFIFLSQKGQKIEWKYDDGGIEFCQLSSKSQPNLVNFFSHSRAEQFLKQNI